MSDSSSYYNTFDLDDMDDIELIMQAIKQDQPLQQNEAESSRRTRKAINSERDLAEARLVADYFGEYLKYTDYYFRRRYRMKCSLFLEIVQCIETYIEIVHPLPGHFKFFVVRPDAMGLMSFGVIIKCTFAIRQLAYGTSPDALDEYLQMGEHYAHDCDKIYPTIMLEAVASYDLWIWHAFFGVADVNNDLTALNHSPLFDNLLDDIALVVLYEVNGVTFEKRYYLADGIYPQWASFVKPFTDA
ncbi:putative nuclease HARBI1 [Tanacetum coccineum]